MGIMSVVIILVLHPHLRGFSDQSFLVSMAHFGMKMGARSVVLHNH